MNEDLTLLLLIIGVMAIGSIAAWLVSVIGWLTIIIPFLPIIIMALWPDKKTN